MKTVFLVYVFLQLVSTAYGVSVIESVKPFYEAELIDQGYHKNKNSLYRFNSTLSDILKAFIPFYYLIKALGIVLNKGDLSKEVSKQIESKNFITDEDEIQVTPEIEPVEVKQDDYVLENIDFNKPEKYTARKNDISFYDTYETPVDYITREATQDDNLELSPFVQRPKVVERVVERVVKEEMTSKDVAEYLCDLDKKTRNAVIQQLQKLNEIEDNKSLVLEKDVA